MDNDGRLLVEQKSAPNAKGKSRLRKFHQLLIYYSCGLVLFWAVGGITVYKLFGDWGSRGLFGDMFGSVNALLSALAFAAIVSALLLQKEDVDLTRQEIRRASDAHEQSAKLLASQQVLMQEQFSFVRRQQLAAAQAFFCQEIPKRGDTRSEVRIQNIGNRAVQIRLEWDSGEKSRDVAFWNAGESHNLIYDDGVSSDEVVILYSDILGIARRCLLTVGATASRQAINAFHEEVNR